MKLWPDMTRTEREEAAIAARNAGEAAPQAAKRLGTTTNAIRCAWARLLREGRLAPFDRETLRARIMAAQTTRGCSGNPAWDDITPAERHDKVLALAERGLSRADAAGELGISQKIFRDALCRARRSRGHKPPPARDWSRIDPVICAEWGRTPGGVKALARRFHIADSTISSRAVTVLGLPLWRDARADAAAAAPAIDLDGPHYAGPLTRELGIRAIRSGDVSLPYIPTLHGRAG